MKYQRYACILSKFAILLALALPLTGGAQFTFITNADDTLTLTGYIGSGGSVTIPDTINGHSVTTMGPDLFFGYSAITNVIIPSSVTSIGVDAFFGCPNLMSAAVPDSVTNLGDHAFAYCSQLTYINIPQGLTRIGVQVFGSCSGLTNAVIPNSVTNIGNSAFAGCSGLNRMTIPNNVLSIGQYTFLNCFGLTNLLMGSSLNTIGDWAFNGCSGLTSLLIPDSVSLIGTGAFSCPKLTNVTIGNNVFTIGDEAFQGSSLTSVAVPASVISIGTSAFDSYSLTNITVDVANPAYASVGGILFNKSLTTLIRFPAGLPGSYAIPGTVTNAASYSFLFCSGLTGINLGAIVNIGDYAFDGCSALTTVTIPNSVTNIGNYAFAYTYYLHEAIFLGDAPYVNGGDGSTNNTVFYNGFGTVYYTPGTTGWSAAFGGWPTIARSYPLSDFLFTTNNGAITITGYIGSGGTVAIPGTINGYPVTTIAGSAFYHETTVTNVTIPNSVTNLAPTPFYLCSSLINISVDAANPNYASAGGVLFDKTLTTLVECPAGLAGSHVVSNSVTSIMDNAFTACSGLTNITLGNNLTRIGDFGFSECAGLTRLSIPGSVTNIGSQAFSYCSSLTNIAVDAANPWFASAAGVLFNKNLALLIEYPVGLTGSYVIPNTVAQIGDFAFANCFNLTSVTFPNSLTNIGNYAFEACAGLTNMTIPGNVASLGNWSFAYCTSLHQAYFQGNAPTVNGQPGSADTTIFYGQLGTVYFVPGTKGWSGTFGNWPTAAWYQPQPQILRAGSGWSAPNRSFQFTISWATNTTVVVETSTNLQNWDPVTTNTVVNGTNAFTDSTSANDPRRFYRVHSQ
jgi:hypothetical protein